MREIFSARETEEIHLLAKTKGRYSRVYRALIFSPLRQTNLRNILYQAYSRSYELSRAHLGSRSRTLVA